MKKLTSLKLSSFVFAIFMFLPMFSILSRVIYVQSNPNAIDSYTENLETIEIPVYYDSNVATSNNDLIIGNLYYFHYDNNQPDLSNRISFKFSELYVVTYSSKSNIQSTGSQLDNFAQVFTYNNANFFRVFQFIDNAYYYTDFYDFEGYIVYDGYVQNSIAYTYLQYTDYKVVKEYIPYTYTDTMDNVFDYSLKTFLEDDNNYAINFFDFFGNTFLNQSGRNMLYLNFLNWYMNYGLLVSCGYILFFILYFFINVVRKLVLSFTNKIEGGF